MTNLARLCAETLTDRIVVSQRVADVAAFASAGPLTLKGFARAVPAWSVEKRS